MTNEWCHEYCKKLMLDLWDISEFPGVCHEYCNEENCKYDHVDYRDEG